MNNYNEVKKSFGTQAEKFASYHMSKAEYTDYLIRSIQAKGNEHALEVAAGTCICGRAVAPYVKDITCLDLTEAMLEQGKKLAKQEGIQNISFVSGNAECLPFEDETFDLVITRLSLHHLLSLKSLFGEMQRVLKKGGKLVIWDNGSDYRKNCVKLMTLLKRCVITHIQEYLAEKNLKHCSMVNKQNGKSGK